MKILIVNTRHYYGGGDSTYAFNLASLLRSKGHEVAFFAMQDERNLPDPNSDLFVSNIDFRELNRNKNLVNGFKVLTRSIYSTEARQKFSKLLSRVNPDIVHLNGIHGHITPSVIFEAKKRGLPVIWTQHDYKLICPNTHFLIDNTNEICEACRNGKFYQATLKRCKKESFLASAMATLEAYIHQVLKINKRVDCFVTPSNFLRVKLLENGFKSEKVTHLPNFLPDIQVGEVRENQGYLLFLGRLEKIKGIYVLIEAARKIPSVSIILAGRADKEIEKKLPQLLPANVKYIGMQSGKKLDELRNNALSLVNPSIWYENQPFSILELFARGKPVIASRLGGMEELVGENERGLLVPPGNAQLLAEALKFAIANPASMKEKGRNAFNYVLSNHTAERHYQKIMKIYQMNN